MYNQNYQVAQYQPQQQSNFIQQQQVQYQQVQQQTQLPTPYQNNGFGLTQTTTNNNVQQYQYSPPPTQMITSPQDLELRYNNFRIWAERECVYLGIFNSMDYNKFNVRVLESYVCDDINGVNNMFQRYGLPFIYQPFFKPIRVKSLRELYKIGAGFNKEGILIIPTPKGEFPISGLHLNIIDSHGSVIYETTDSLSTNIKVDKEVLIFPKFLEDILYSFD